jgi:hypothetical protein
MVNNYYATQLFAGISLKGDVYAIPCRNAPTSQ